MATLLVTHEPKSAADARQALSADLAAHGVDAVVVDEVLLIATELLANAIRHASPDPAGLRVSWELDARAVRIDVVDRDYAAPTPLRPQPTEPGGRGLTIVDALSYEWGYDRLINGKRVWARIPLPTGSGRSA